MPHHPYPSDFTDAQRAILEPLFPPVRAGGRPARHARRDLVDAMLHVLRAGCAWRMLAYEYLPWSTVYWYFRRRRDGGMWEWINAALRQRARIQEGGTRNPAQPFSTVRARRPRERGPRGYDGGKQVNGRKRHLLSARRYDRVAAEGGSAPDHPAGSRRRELGAGRAERAVPPPGASRGGRGLPWTVRRLGDDHARVVGDDRANAGAGCAWPRDRSHRRTQSASRCCRGGG